MPALLKVDFIMSKIRFYISSHGFGHSTREIAVMSKLPDWIDIEIITSAPKWLFEKSLNRQFTYHELCHDPGIIQFDCLHQDSKRTLEQWTELLNQYPSMADKELTRFKNNPTALIVGDISPFALAVAEKAKVPCVIIANFSWDWILSALLKYDSNFQSIIDQISTYYQKTTLLLRTPLAGDLSVFPRIKDIPLIARQSNQSRQEARQQFGLKDEERIVLISFGGHDIEHIPLNRLQAHSEITFLTFNKDFTGPNNLRFLDPIATYHPDAVQASNIVLAKMGYGIVTECIAHGIPIAYPPRSDFPEHDVLVHETKQYIPIQELSSEDFFSGKWEFLDTLYSSVEEKKKCYFAIPNVSGDEQAAQILTELVKNT